MGFKIGPAELEGILTAHLDVVDAAVIGIQFHQTANFHGRTL